MERWGQMIDRACAGIGDPAEVFAVSFRISGRFGMTRPHPDLARFLAGRGLDLLDAPAGLAPRALRDITAGEAAGRFTIPDAGIALCVVAGGLLALLRPPECHPAHAGQALVDQLAEGMLRMLGIPAAEAARLAAAPLPETGAWR